MKCTPRIMSRSRDTYHIIIPSSKTKKIDPFRFPQLSFPNITPPAAQYLWDPLAFAPWSLGKTSKRFGGVRNQVIRAFRVRGRKNMEKWRHGKKSWWTWHFIDSLMGQTRSMVIQQANWQHQFTGDFPIKLSLNHLETSESPQWWHLSWQFQVLQLLTRSKSLDEDPVAIIRQNGACSKSHLLRVVICFTQWQWLWGLWSSHLLPWKHS